MFHGIVIPPSPHPTNYSREEKSTRNDENAQKSVERLKVLLHIFKISDICEMKLTEISY